LATNWFVRLAGGCTDGRGGRWWAGGLDKAGCVTFRVMGAAVTGVVRRRNRDRVSVQREVTLTKRDDLAVGGGRSER
jgi:hypothetical protein